MPGSGSPGVLADGTFFNGRVVAQTAISGSRFWRNTALSRVAVAGSRPWTFAVARWRGVAATQTAFGLGGAAEVQALSALAASTWQGFFGGPVTVNSSGNADTNVHRYKWFLNGTAATLVVDDSQTTTATGISTAEDITKVAVGCSAAAAANVADASVAFFLICSAKPSAAEEAALDAWAKGYWGTP